MMSLMSKTTERNQIMQSLAEALGTIPRISSREKILPGDNNPDLKRSWKKQSEEDENRRENNRQWTTKTINKNSESSEKQSKLTKWNSIDEVLKCGEITITSYNRTQKKCTGPKNKIEWHFNPEHTMLKVLLEIEHKLIYILTLQCLSSNVSNKEPSDEEVKKAVKW